MGQKGTKRDKWDKKGQNGTKGTKWDKMGQMGHSTLTNERSALTFGYYL
jgi:hypothetical protein